LELSAKIGDFSLERRDLALQRSNQLLLGHFPDEQVSEEGSPAAQGYRSPASAFLPPTHSHKIEFSFLKINLVVPAGPLPISILDDKSAKEI
jgi:hypothetical protein